MSFTSDTRLKTPSSGINKNNVSGGVSGGNKGLVGPTWYFDANQSLTTAVKSKGSSAITTTVSRGSSNPATYIDSAGVMQVTTTSNVPRGDSFYYDLTGIHAWPNTLFKVESQRTNYHIRSVMDTGSTTPDDHILVFIGGSPDTTELIDATDVFNVADTVRYWHLAYENIADGEDVTSQVGPTITSIGSFSQNDYCTFSVRIKGTMTGGNAVMRTIEYDSLGVSGTIHSSSVIQSSFSNSEWSLFTYTVRLVDSDVSKVIVHIRLQDIDQSTGDSFNLNFVLFQIEKGQGVTSHIPTKGSSLTRNKETHTFPVLNNRTASLESMICKLALNSPSGLTSVRWISATSAPVRRMNFNTQGTRVRINPNFTDSAASETADIIDEAFSANVSLTIGYNFQSGKSPYTAGFYNGVADGTNDTSDDFTPNVWSSDLSYIGSSNVGVGQLNGGIFQMAFYDRILTARQNLYAHNNSGISVPV